MSEKTSSENEAQSGTAVALRIALFLGGTIALVLAAKFFFGV